MATFSRTLHVRYDRKRRILYLMPAGRIRDIRAFSSETKFLVPAALGEPIRQWARQHLKADPHGHGAYGDEYLTTTLYFDTPAFDVFHRRGSYGRSKYRIRRYNGSADVFLERKLRRPGILTKRRTPVPVQALAYLTEELDGWAGEWFHRRLSLRKLRPVCEISYHRIARGLDGGSGPIRLTLDERLTAHGIERPAFGEGTEGCPFVEGRLILELKYRQPVPAVFKRLVEEFRLVPCAVSKYRLGMTALGMVEAPVAAAVPLGVSVPVAESGRA
jgi:hypothetical protein